MGSPHDDVLDLPPRLAESTPYLLTRAVRTAARRAQPAFDGETLRFPHYATACWIEHLGPCSQIALARAMSVDPSDLVTVLRALEAERVLHRSPDAADRRRRLLELTDEGRDWVEQRAVRARGFEQELCRGTDDSGAALRAQLTALLVEEREDA